MTWKPDVTVAAVVEQNGKFLLVEEQVHGGILLNQPAGHLEPDESITQGVIRETLEETGYTFTPQWVIGIYRWHSQIDNIIFLRFAFAGFVSDHDPDRALDAGILRAEWFGPDEIRKMVYRHRSPLVMKCVEDHLAGKRYSMEILTHYD
jgi:8-oxo-dGTP pyrophosphatase MutT (NUDIX family)